MRGVHFSSIVFEVIKIILGLPSFFLRKDSERNKSNKKFLSLLFSACLILFCYLVLV